MCTGTLTNQDHSSPWDQSVEDINEVELFICLNYCLSCVYFSGAVDLIKYTKAAEAHGSLVS